MVFYQIPHLKQKPKISHMCTCVLHIVEWYILYLCSVHCAMYIVQLYTLYSIHGTCALQYTVQYTWYLCTAVHCTVYTVPVHCSTLYSIHGTCALQYLYSIMVHCMGFSRVFFQDGNKRSITRYSGGQMRRVTVKLCVVELS